MIFQWLYRQIVGRFFRLYIKKISGLENIRPDKPAIYIANHPSHWDSAILISVLGRKLKIPARMIVSRKLVSSEAGGHWRIRRFFYVTLPGSIETGGAVEKAIEALKKGEAVVLYPEGRVVRKGEKVKPKPGMALFALGAKVPIIPIKIIGTDKIWPERQKNPNFADYFKFKRVEVVIGKPIELTKFYHKKVSEKEIQKIANKIMEKLYKL